MSWFTCRILLENPSCHAAEAFQTGAPGTCLSPAHRQGAPLIHTTGPIPDGWEDVGADPRGRLTRMPDGDCSVCPFGRLPREVRCLDVNLREGVLRADLLLPSQTALRDMMERFRMQGQRPRILRTGTHDGMPVPGMFIDPSVLTPRQREALEAAVEIGYFARGDASTESLAERMGCSRSTAHEHLRKGLERLLAASFAAPQTGEPSH